MDNLRKIFGIRKNDVVSIVGAGGKTSLLYTLGDYFDNSLVTTTTKLFAPEDRKFVVGELPSKIDGSLVVAKSQKENKLYGFSSLEIEQFYRKFDYTFIEADGARMKNLKAWNSTEPVICDFNNKTIGVLDIQTLGKNTRDTVFRLDEYSKITEVEKNVSLHNLVDITLHSNGLFKFSDYKILYINKVEIQEHLNDVVSLLELLLKDDRFNLDRIVVGSIFNQTFEVVYKSRANFILASGLSQRMGEDKLSINYKGKVLVEHIVEKLSKFPDDVFLITNNERFNDLANKYDIDVLINDFYENGQSESIKKALVEDYHLYTYFLGDMPNISNKTIERLLKNKSELVACGSKELFSAPATLSKKYRSELLSLEGDQGAKKVLKKHLNSISFVEIDDIELKDIDTKEDLEV